MPPLACIALCHPKEVSGQEIVWIFGDFLTNDRPHNSIYGLRSDLEEQYSTDRLKQSMNSLEDNTDAETSSEKGSILGTQLACQNTCST